MRSERDIVPVYTSFSDQKQGVGAFDCHFDSIIRPKRGVSTKILARFSLIFVRSFLRRVYGSIWLLGEVMESYAPEKRY